ncbi:hypothetical protein HYY75_07955 [bacterium]|nr:hypothetical protein [bacterium]
MPAFECFLQVPQTIAVMLLFFSFFAAPLLGKNKYYAPLLEYETVRIRGMGGVSVAVADDHQALLSNPAGLFQIKNNKFAVVNADGEINQDFRRVKNKTSGLSDKDTPENRAENNSILSSIMGQYSRTLASNFAYYLGEKGFGAGFLYQALGQIDVVRPTNPQVRAFGLIDSVLSGSLSKPIPGVRSLFQDQALGWWGITLKFLSRQFLDKSYFARDFASLNESALRAGRTKGETFDFDGGTFWQLNNPWNQTLGLTVFNVFETEIDPTIGSLRRRLNLGTTIRPLTGPPDRNHGHGFHLEPGSEAGICPAALPCGFGWFALNLPRIRMKSARGLAIEKIGDIALILD